MGRLQSPRLQSSRSSRDRSRGPRCSNLARIIRVDLQRNVTRSSGFVEDAQKANCPNCCLASRGCHVGACRSTDDIRSRFRTGPVTPHRCGRIDFPRRDCRRHCKYRRSAEVTKKEASGLRRDERRTASASLSKRWPQRTGRKAILSQNLRLARSRAFVSRNPPCRRARLDRSGSRDGGFRLRADLYPSGQAQQGGVVVLDEAVKMDKSKVRP